MDYINMFVFKRCSKSPLNLNFLLRIIAQRLEHVPDKRKVVSSKLTNSIILWDIAKWLRHWFLILIFKGSNPFIPV